VRLLAALAAAFALPAGFNQVAQGPAGGTIWRGEIPGAARESAIYLPPGFSAAQRYPVVYLLHGMPGSPWSYIRSLSLASLSDTLITRREARPFIAVIPVAGPTGHYDGEWAGPWEDYVVDDVVPWVDAHLPTIASPAGRTIAGLSAGGYGAVDIALRHPGLFGQVESWGGYFEPFADGPLAGAAKDVLSSHDPAVLVRGEATPLRDSGVRFFLSTGPGHGQIRAADTTRFARELSTLGVANSLLELPPAEAKHPWEPQLAAGLRWAFGSSGR
jgi:S-formylglutathione hydrolase FrmB